MTSRDNSSSVINSVLLIARSSLATSGNIDTTASSVEINSSMRVSATVPSSGQLRFVVQTTIGLSILGTTSVAYLGVLGIAIRQVAATTELRNVVAEFVVTNLTPGTQLTSLSPTFGYSGTAGTTRIPDPSLYGPVVFSVYSN